MVSTSSAVSGAWEPLREPTFRALWLAILAGNIGTWVHDVAATWMMAEMTGSPLMVAAVQSATTLPVVLLALFAGALADIVDRRRYLIATQLWMIAMATMLALLAHLDRLNPWSLLALTFALGAGAAMAMPAQAATTPELVPRAMIGQAAALGSISMNIARSIGPALGGLVVAQFSVATAFALNALSFIGIVVVLWRWRRTPPVHALPPERFGGALRAGLRYALHATVFQAVILKAACFFVFASALPALLPIVVREALRGGAGTYGLLLGFVGIGAVSGALLLPQLRARMDRDQMVLWGAVGNAACMVSVALVTSVPVLCVVMLANGLTWITVLSSFQTAAQLSVPPWVRARALSLYIVTFALGMAVGSLTWGAIAQYASLMHALIAAAIGTTLASVWARRYRLGPAEMLDVMPSSHWPQPIEVDGAAGDRGPVLVTVEYEIAPPDRDAFLRLMAELGRSRRRDGALQWDVMEDAAQPGMYLEYFVVGSWLEHLRQHDRVTGEEARLQTLLRELHRGAGAPAVRHFLGGPPRSGAPTHRHRIDPSSAEPT